MWVVKIIRWLFLVIDKLVYWLVNLMYQLFIMISEATIFGPETIQTFSSRIYVLLGIVMLFRVAIAMVNYIMKPDSFTDNKQGGASLIRKLVIVLISIIAVPYGFEAAYTLQRIVLKSNLIGTVILGTETNDGPDYTCAAELGVSLTDKQKKIIEEEDYVERGGKTMSYVSFSAFFRIEEEIFGEECAALPVKDPTTGSCAKWKEEWDREDGICRGPALSNKMSDDKIDEVKDLLAKSYVNNSSGELNDLTVGTMTTKIPYTDNKGKEKKKEIFVIDYKFLISTAVGGFLTWILLLFCIDIAVRSVKLGFLQLIAPIPLVSYLAPGEKGQKTLSNWVGECGKTYGDVFMRLAAIYFAIFIISEIVDKGIKNSLTGETIWNPFVIIFIILGTLMFAKQLPDLLKNLLGVDFGGKFTLNPSKKIAEGALGGQHIAKGMDFMGRGAKNLGMAGANLAGAGLGAGGSWLANKTGIPQAIAERRAHNARARELREIFGAPNTMDRIRNRAAAMGKGVRDFGGKVDELSGNRFSDIGEDARATGQDIMGGLGFKSASDRQAGSKRIIAHSKAIKDMSEKEAMKHKNVIEKQAFVDALKSGGAQNGDTPEQHSKKIAAAMNDLTDTIKSTTANIADAAMGAANGFEDAAKDISASVKVHRDAIEKDMSGSYTRKDDTAFEGNVSTFADMKVVSSRAEQQELEIATRSEFRPASGKDKK